MFARCFLAPFSTQGLKFQCHIWGILDIFLCHIRGIGQHSAILGILGLFYPWLLQLAIDHDMHIDRLIGQGPLLARRKVIGKNCFVTCVYSIFLNSTFLCAQAMRHAT